MRTSVDLPAPFSPTRAWISPGITSKSTLSSARVAPKCLAMPRAFAAGTLIGKTRLTCDAHDAHLLVGEFAALDDHVVVERHRAVAHRHVVMALGGALAATLRVRPGGEQKVAGEAAGAGVMPCRLGAVERDRIPAALRV